MISGLMAFKPANFGIAEVKQCNHRLNQSKMRSELRSSVDTRVPMSISRTIQLHCKVRLLSAICDVSVVCVASVTKLY